MSNEKPSKIEQLKKIISKRIYILQWLPGYTKMDVVSDCIAGITVGLTMMPQSMAYASLVNLPAQYGLYSAFMGSFVYVFFGTIKEVSIGPTSLMSLLTFSICRDLPIDFMILLTFLAGCIELFLGVLNLGFLVDFISAPVVSAFTSATSVLVIMSQLKSLIGVKFYSEGVFEWIYKFFQHIPEMALGDSLLGIFSMIFLLSLKQLPKIKTTNEGYKKMLWLLSIGRNALIVLITSSLAAAFEHFYGKIPFKIYGTVAKGIPSFRLPSFSTRVGNETLTFVDMVGNLGSGLIIVPVFAVLLNVAIAKCFSAGKVIDVAQEIMTLGLSNILGSFVQSMPTSGAFTRSAVCNASGIRSPMAGLYSGSIILLALMFLTPYFYYVPKATLSAVLISAVLFMIDYEIIPKLWISNKFDLGVTLITLAVSLFYGMELGLAFGVAVSLFPLLKYWTRPKIDLHFMKSQSGEHFLMFKPELGFLFPAVDYTTQEIIKCVNDYQQFDITTVVLDFSRILSLDYSSSQALLNLKKTLKQMSVKLKFINVSRNIYEHLKKSVGEDVIQCCEDIEEYTFGTNIAHIPNPKDVENPLIEKLDTNSSK